MYVTLTKKEKIFELREKVYTLGYEIKLCTEQIKYFYINFHDNYKLFKNVLRR